MSDRQFCFVCGCGQPAQGNFPFCRSHWQLVPRELRERIIAATYAGQRKGRFGLMQQAAALINNASPVSVETVLITGRTFPVKEKLKEMGGYWDADARAWRVPKHMKMAAEVLVGNAEQFEQLPGMEEEC